MHRMEAQSRKKLKDKKVGLDVFLAQNKKIFITQTKDFLFFGLLRSRESYLNITGDVAISNQLGDKRGLRSRGGSTDYRFLRSHCYEIG